MTDGSVSTEMAVNAHRHDFTSAITGRDYRLFVSVPVGEPPEKGWPVVYLIDANLHFGITVDTARIQARWPDTKDAVIVGIGYQTDSVGVALEVRNKDLTPPTPESWTTSGWQAAMRSTPEQFGDIDLYIRMLIEEVPPLVDTIVRTDPEDRILMGHSLGGLTTLTTFLRWPEAFAQYVAVSPSIWMTDKWVLQFVDDFIAKAETGSIKARILMSAGEYENGRTLFPPLPKTGSPMTQETYETMQRDCAMTDNAMALVQRLAPLKSKGVEAEFVEHPDEDHRSVVPAGIARGIYFTLYRP